MARLSLSQSALSSLLRPSHTNHTHITQSLSNNVSPIRRYASTASHIPMDSRPAHIDRKLENLSSTFIVYYAPIQKPSLAAHMVLDDSRHPKHILTTRRHAQRDRNCLWWYAFAGISLSQKRVVRSWAQRRVRQAFIEALERRGFDRDGRMVSEGLAEKERREMRSFNLRGSLRLQMVNESVLTAKFEVVKRDAERVVHWLIGERRKQFKGRDKFLERIHAKT